MLNNAKVGDIYSVSYSKGGSSPDLIKYYVYQHYPTDDYIAKEIAKEVRLGLDSWRNINHNDEFMILNHPAIIDNCIFLQILLNEKPLIGWIKIHKSCWVDFTIIDHAND